MLMHVAARQGFLLRGRIGVRFVASPCRSLLHRILHRLRIADHRAVEVFVGHLQVVLPRNILRVADPFADHV